MVWSNFRRTLVVLMLVGFACADASAQTVKRLPSVEGLLIDWTHDYHAALTLSAKEKKPILLDFYADWCGPCQMMDAQVYADPRVIAALADFIPVKIDIDRDTKTAFAYRIRSIPRTVVLNIYGEMLGDIVGYFDADEFLQFLRDTAKEALVKIDGTRINVPKQSGPAAKPGPTVAPTTALKELTAMLSNQDPAQRKMAEEELLRRQRVDVLPALTRLLRDEYLGARIAGWKVYRSIENLERGVFDPWSAAGERETMLGALNE